MVLILWIIGIVVYLIIARTIVNLLSHTKRLNLSPDDNIREFEMGFAVILFPIVILIVVIRDTSNWLALKIKLLIDK